MAYYRSNNRSSNPTKGRWMDLRYAGRCSQCAQSLPTGARAFYDPADRSICCTALECAESYGATEEKWIGSPVSGSWVRTLSSIRIRPTEPSR